VATKTEREAFFAQALPYAEDAHDRTGIPVSVILAQWGLESAFGTSWIAQQGNNYAGIKYGSSKGNQDGPGIIAPDGSGPYGIYNSWARFTNHYAAILEDMPEYAGLRATVEAGGSPEDILQALSESRWAESRYRDRPAELGGIIGQALRNVIAQDDLTRFDVGEIWEGAGFGVRPGRGGYQVTVPDQFRGTAWPAVLIVAGALGLAALMGPKK
jgi:hypothetical protein